MTQRDIPVQPNESDEVRAGRRLAGLAGWCVTHTIDGDHVPGSLHKVKATNGIGRAIDLADKEGPASVPPTPAQAAALLAINEAIILLLPLSMIDELIYGGPNGICVKNGRRVDGHVVYADVIAAHKNHVHLGVILGFRYDVAPEVPVPDNPDLPNLPDILGFYPVINTTTGRCEGYYILAKDGELHAFGPGAPFYGRSEVLS